MFFFFLSDEEDINNFEEDINNFISIQRLA